MLLSFDDKNNMQQNKSAIKVQKFINTIVAGTGTSAKPEKFCEKEKRGVDDLKNRAHSVFMT